MQAEHVGRAEGPRRPTAPSAAARSAMPSPGRSPPSTTTSSVTVLVAEQPHAEVVDRVHVWEVRARERQSTPARTGGDHRAPVSAPDATRRLDIDPFADTHGPRHGPASWCSNQRSRSAFTADVAGHVGPTAAEARGGVDQRDRVAAQRHDARGFQPAGPPPTTGTERGTAAVPDHELILATRRPVRGAAHLAPARSVADATVVVHARPDLLRPTGGEPVQAASGSARIMRAIDTKSQVPSAMAASAATGVDAPHRDHRHVDGVLHRTHVVEQQARHLLNVGVGGAGSRPRGRGTPRRAPRPHRPPPRGAPPRCSRRASYRRAGSRWS